MIRIKKYFVILMVFVGAMNENMGASCFVCESRQKEVSKTH